MRRRFVVPFQIAAVAPDFADFFLLLFLGAAGFHLAAPVPGATSDIHLRAPVRLFFQLDPLVALTNALAGHALYRGLLWSLVILIPTLFLGRFFCGWICPMGTLQHCVRQPALGNQARQAAHRIQPLQALADDQIRRADRGPGGRLLRHHDRWAGSIRSACWCARSACRCCPRFNFAVRAVLHADGAQPRRRRQSNRRERCIRFSGAYCSISASRTFRRALSSAFSSSSFLRPACASRASGAARFARWGRCWACFRAGPSSACTRKTRPATTATAACCTARAATIPSAAFRGASPSATVYELRGRVPGPRPRVPFLPQERRGRSARPGRRKTHDRAGRRRGRRSADARQRRAWAKGATSGCCVRRARWRKRTSSRAASAAASA